MATTAWSLTDEIDVESQGNTAVGTAWTFTARAHLSMDRLTPIPFDVTVTGLVTTDQHDRPTDGEISDIEFSREAVRFPTPTPKFAISARTRHADLLLTGYVRSQVSAGLPNGYLAGADAANPLGQEVFKNLLGPMMKTELQARSYLALVTAITA